MTAPFSLYIHIPYCISKCPYCDFNSHVVAEIPEQSYTEALLRELAHHGAQPDWQGRSLQSVFFGGGTPSLLSPAGVDQLLGALRARLPMTANAEITLEANPGTVDESRFAGFRSQHVTQANTAQCHPANCEEVSPGNPITKPTFLTGLISEDGKHEIRPSSQETLSGG